MNCALVAQGRNTSIVMEKSINPIKKIVLAIIENEKHEILIAKRKLAVDQSCLWELPGGKIEKNETPFEAMQREVKEEVALTVELAEHLLNFTHEYPDRTLLFDVFYVKTYEGQAIGAEGQEIRWVSVENINQYTFPLANQKMAYLFNLVG